MGSQTFSRFFDAFTEDFILLGGSLAPLCLYITCEATSLSFGILVKSTSRDFNFSKISPFCGGEVSLRILVESVYKCLEFITLIPYSATRFLKTNISVTLVALFCVRLAASDHMVFCRRGVDDGEDRENVGCNKIKGCSSSKDGNHGEGNHLRYDRSRRWKSVVSWFFRSNTENRK